jgi:excisionase family DNA binding protein
MVRELCQAKWSKIMNSALTKSETNSSAVPTPRNTFEPFVSADAVACYVGIERPTSRGEWRQPKNGAHTVNEWLTSDEAARYLKINRRTLLEWARQGKLKAYKLPGIIRHVWRFRQKDLDDMLSLSSADSADGRQQ